MWRRVTWAMHTCVGRAWFEAAWQQWRDVAGTQQGWGHASEQGAGCKRVFGEKQVSRDGRLERCHAMPGVPKGTARTAIQG